MYELKSQTGWELGDANIYYTLFLHDVLNPTKNVRALGAFLWVVLFDASHRPCSGNGMK